MGRHPKTTLPPATTPDRRRNAAVRCDGLGSAADRDLVELVDAVVAAIDADRSWEVERVAAAFQPFRGAELFVDELRLNGTVSTECPCRAEGWL